MKTFENYFEWQDVPYFALRVICWHIENLMYWRWFTGIKRRDVPSYSTLKSSREILCPESLLMRQCRDMLTWNHELANLPLDEMMSSGSHELVNLCHTPCSLNCVFCIERNINTEPEEYTTVTYLWRPWYQACTRTRYDKRTGWI